MTSNRPTLSETRGHIGRQKGFSLIEALIALVILSIGLAGMAQMNMSSIQNAHSSYLRSIASSVALDFEERLWLEVADNALFGCPDMTSGAGSPSAELIADWTSGTPDPDWGWSTLPRVQVPNLAVTMGTPVVGDMITEVPITLSWTESRHADVSGTGEQFNYTVRIVCRPAAT